MKTSRAFPMVLLLAAASALAAEVVTFESCTDTAGRTVPVEADYAQPMLVRTIQAAGQPAIRHNPGVLPRLTFAVRQFFVAHECARHAMGEAGKAASLAKARQADCVGLSTLIASGLVQRQEIADLQGRLKFSGTEWQLLPGPPRDIDFTACRIGNALRLPPSAAPSARLGEWNACARACGDRLWACQKRCRDGACETTCLDAHHQCEADCGPKPD